MIIIIVTMVIMITLNSNNNKSSTKNSKLEVLLSNSNTEHQGICKLYVSHDIPFIMGAYL